MRWKFYQTVWLPRNMTVMNARLGMKNVILMPKKSGFSVTPSKDCANQKAVVHLHPPAQSDRQNATRLFFGLAHHADSIQNSNISQIWSPFHEVTKNFYTRLHLLPKVTCELHQVLCLPNWSMNFTKSWPCHTNRYMEFETCLIVIHYFFRSAAPAVQSDT